MWHIFEKRIVQGYQKWYSRVSNMQIQKYKYKNTHTHKYSIWRSARKTQHVVYFWREDCSTITKIIFPCVKHANTKIQIQNTQIHKYSIWRSVRKTQHVVYFWRGGCARLTKIIFPCVKHANTKIQIHTYKNTAYDQVPETPNMWHIFEKRIVQGYQKWCWCTDDNSLIMMHWQYCYIPQSLCVCHLEYSLRALVQHPCNARVIYHKSFTTTQIEIVRPGVECFPDLLGIFW